MAEKPTDAPLFGADGLRQIERINEEIRRNGRRARRPDADLPLFERRDEWAAGRRTKQDAAFGRVASIADNIPLGQPILVGHHSEKRARRDQERITAGMIAGIEHGKMAEHHGQAADTIRRQLDESIYRDDVDEADRLEVKLTDLEAKRDRRKAINTWIRKNLRKHGRTSQHLTDNNDGAADLLKAAREALTLTRAETTDILQAVQFNAYLGYPSYALSNLSGTIKRTRDRLPAARERAAQRRRVADVLAAERPD